MALRTVDNRGACWSTKAAIWMLALTATRCAAARGMCWSEVDGDVWMIPGERAKIATPSPLRVPLSSGAVEVLEKARSQSAAGGLVFSSQRGRQTTVEALSKLYGELGLAMTPHGLRSHSAAGAPGEHPPRVGRDSGHRSPRRRRRLSTIRPPRSTGRGHRAMGPIPPRKGHQTAIVEPPGGAPLLVVSLSLVG